MYALLSVCLLTSCERPPADGSSPFSLGRLSLGELHPETGVLLLLGDESGKKERERACLVDDNTFWSYFNNILLYVNCVFHIILTSLLSCLITIMYCCGCSFSWIFVCVCEWLPSVSGTLCLIVGGALSFRVSGLFRVFRCFFSLCFTFRLGSDADK